MPQTTADELRKAFREISQSVRQRYQPFAIRVWRGISWLDRAEQAAELEDRFIASWIGFNALYGRVDRMNRPWHDRDAYQKFLATVWRRDRDGLLLSTLQARRRTVLSLIGNKYLFEKYWADPGGDHDTLLQVYRDEAAAGLTNGSGLSVLQNVFKRLYVMRIQVFHGASTKGSSLNRRTLNQSADLLRALLPAMIEVMIQRGVRTDWGRISFPPTPA